MGATPGGIVYCSCCGTGTLEIKCPNSCRERSFEHVANKHNSTFCLYQDEDGSLYLKKENAYYYQIQMQMQLSQAANYCDFVLWREGEIFYQKILLDKNFIDDDTFQKAKIFAKIAILPELNGKWFSK